MQSHTRKTKYTSKRKVGPKKVRLNSTTLLGRFVISIVIRVGSSVSMCVCVVVSGCQVESCIDVVHSNSHIIGTEFRCKRGLFIIRLNDTCDGVDFITLIIHFVEEKILYMVWFCDTFCIVFERID